jgi:hypothetical protein
MDISFIYGGGLLLLAFSTINFKNKSNKPRKQTKKNKNAKTVSQNRPKRGAIVERVSVGAERWPVL